MGNGLTRKDRAILWCLAEAKRQKSRDVLRHSVALTLMQDKRKDLLLIRFKSCSADLETGAGNIGLFGAGGTGADIAVATMQGLQTLCTTGVPKNNSTENQA